MWLGQVCVEDVAVNAGSGHSDARSASWEETLAAALNGRSLCFPKVAVGIRPACGKTGASRTRFPAVGKHEPWGSRVQLAIPRVLVATCAWLERFTIGGRTGGNGQASIAC
ncbi:MAG: hypothetical protein EHM77_03320, partial [Planctomycetaceae bacterium]